MNVKILIVGLVLGATCGAHATHANSASPDSGAVMKGDQPGTVFRTLTVEGEDRVHLEIARPTLRLDLDPADAPGLDLGSARDVLDRTRPNLIGPLLTSVAAEPSAFTARPWLQDVSSGPVARFRPEVSDIETWQLVVTDSRGHTAATFDGKSNPPKEIAWNGLGEDGSPALPGLVYSYVLDARDRAGNRRHFMGEGFQVPSHLTRTDQGQIMVIAGDDFGVPRQAGRGQVASAAALEATTWLNQEPIDRRIEIAVVARTHERAAAVAQTAREQIETTLLGDPVRVRERLIVEPEAPLSGAVIITTQPAP